MSNMFPSTLGNPSFFTTIYIIISFVIIYPSFSSEKKFYTIVLIFGLLFDIMYTSSFIYNMVSFLVLGIFVRILYNIFPENYFTTNIISIITISLYHVLSFIIFSLVGSINYDFILLFDIIIHSILMTIFYTSISYFVMKYIYNKLNIKYIK